MMQIDNKNGGWGLDENMRVVTTLALMIPLKLFTLYDKSSCWGLVNEISNPSGIFHCLLLHIFEELYLLLDIMGHIS